MTPTQEAGLKPCPFCQHEVELKSYDSDGWISYLSCSGCDMQGPVSEFKYGDPEDAKADALERWKSAWPALSPEPMQADLRETIAREVLNAVFSGFEHGQCEKEWEPDYGKEITALAADKVLAAMQAKSEPVAWRWETPIPHVGDGTRWGWSFASHPSTPPPSVNPQPLYAHPSPSAPNPDSAGLVEWFSGQRALELSYGYDEPEDEGSWRVHRHSGGVNDREWDLVAQAKTVAEALRLASLK